MLDEYGDVAGISMQWNYSISKCSKKLLLKQIIHSFFFGSVGENHSRQKNLLKWHSWCPPPQKKKKKKLENMNDKRHYNAAVAKIFNDDI